MSSGIVKTKGYVNTVLGVAKQTIGKVLRSAELYRGGKCQREKGHAQIVWGQEERVRERALKASDPMVKKLMGRED
jgi:uncharacterized protein YjbJ (UPF0337 family)